jgi:hypothetical protein
MVRSRGISDDHGEAFALLSGQAGRRRDNSRDSRVDLSGRPRATDPRVSHRVEMRAIHVDSTAHTFCRQRAIGNSLT